MSSWPIVVSYGGGDNSHAIQIRRITAPKPARKDAAEAKGEGEL